uniref:methyltransferase domain-containing protein n=1 Tax=Chloroflexus sp. TaxID=1904827 RepID=UPI002ACEAF97
MIPLLHQPYLACIRHALLAATPAGARVAIDVGCGDGSKTLWLRERCAPDALLIGIDRDAAALRAAPALAAIAGDA